MMNVRELIEELQKLDPELVVMKQRDDEGNGYSLVYGVDDDAYADSVDARHPEVVTEQDLEYYAEENDAFDRSEYTRVVVLY